MTRMSIDCKRVSVMSIFKKTFPYCLSLATFMVVGMNNSYIPHEAKAAISEIFHPECISLNAHMGTYYNTKPEQTVDYKTELLMDKYIDNAVSGTNRIIKNRKTKGYLKSVRSELPGAPYNKTYGTLHCLYGHYTQLNRALADLNDTINIIPTTSNAHQASISFKQEMTKLYDNPEYPRAIHHGHLYATDAEYNRALNKYLENRMRGKRGDNSDSLRAEYTKTFEKNNYCATMLNPGTIIIVNSGHAIMYLGQGKIENNEFVPDSNGTAICCAYNSEHPAVRLNMWKTTKSFAADIRKIAEKKYEQELHRIDSLQHAEVVNNFMTTLNIVPPQTYRQRGQ